MKFWDASGGEIWVEPTATLTLDDIQSAGQTRDESARIAIEIRFTAAGAEKMHKFTSEQIITTGPSGLSADQAERILEIVNQ